MYLVEVAPQRWTVREQKPKAGKHSAHTKILGTIEFHEFWTYKNGVRVQSGFWIARPPDHGWKETGWKKVESKDAALKFLKDRAKK